MEANSKTQSFLEVTVPIRKEAIENDRRRMMHTQEGGGEKGRKRD